VKTGAHHHGRPAWMMRTPKPMPRGNRPRPTGATSFRVERTRSSVAGVIGSVVATVLDVMWITIEQGERHTIANRVSIGAL
jgi:hypothetical protein